MYVNIETQRLMLRPISLDDTEFIVDLVNSKGWLQFIGERKVKTIHDAKKYIQNIQDTTDYYYTVFELKETQKAIGILTFLKREDEKYPDIGFAILPEFEGQGYTFEAGQYYLEKIIASNKHQNIIAVTLPDNQRSIRLLQKLGLVPIGNYTKRGEQLAYFALQNEK